MFQVDVKNLKKPPIKFEMLMMAPQNTNSVLVSRGADCVVFDAWGRADAWRELLHERGLNLRAIYATHGHGDHISAAPELAQVSGVDWFLNPADDFLINGVNDFLDMFGLPHIPENYKKPVEIQFGEVEILTGVKMQIIPSPGHTPGGVMFWFPQYKVLLIGDTIFQESIGRYDLPGGDENKLFESIHRLYDMNLADDVTVIHGHGMHTTIGWLRQNNPYFRF
ncbi:MAG: MBL fold metallo-hydrolase [Alphaproteobacteria bacterium]|nr:MBL fold metallo-hydrolase [Alphaproteobacteria bacterium]